MTTREKTISVETPVYEVTLDDGTAVRFHDYEMDDGGLRIQYKRPTKFAFPDRRGSNRHRSAVPDPDLETYREALIPFAELDARSVSPIQVGTVTYKRDYECEKEDRGWIFTSYHYQYRSDGAPYVEYDDETLITTETPK